MKEDLKEARATIAQYENGYSIQFWNLNENGGKIYVAETLEKLIEIIKERLKT